MLVQPIQKFLDHSIKYQEHIGQVPANFSMTFIGIDPGNKNMGVTLFTPSCGIYSYEITMPSDRNPIQRIRNIRYALDDVLPRRHPCMTAPVFVAIEGSSFASKFRNTELAEARIAAAEWCMDFWYLNPDLFFFIPPNTVRKLVFGDGKQTAEKYWPDFRPDAASSIAVGLAGLQKYEEDKNDCAKG